jgi:large repetitive protein
VDGGNLKYDPNTNFNGSDSFTYRASDGLAVGDAVTVDVKVNAVNDAPVAKDDSYKVDEDTTLNIDAPGVLSNDTDVDNTAAELQAVQVTGPAHGTLTLNDNGSFEYKPEANYNGPDTFTYKANDGTDDSDTATVSITVNAVNDAPVPEDNSYTTPEDTPLNIGAPGLLGNDTDVEQDPLHVADGNVNAADGISPVSGPANGTVELHEDGSFTYTPNTNYHGTDSFDYQVCDNGSPEPQCSVQTATVNVTIDPRSTTIRKPLTTSTALMRTRL